MAANVRTLVTELGTALGLLDTDPERVWYARPDQLVNVSDADWKSLRDAAVGGERDHFVAAHANGRYFLLADDGLRGRPPALVEWRGPTRSPGDEVAPIDLRVDHVYQVSCKYLSRITLNASPAYLFERLATGGQGRRADDWFHVVDPDGFQALYRAALESLDGESRMTADFPDDVMALVPAQRDVLRRAWTRSPPPAFTASWQEFSDVVSERSAAIWRTNLPAAGGESMLWRLLRIGSAPYFVLGLERKTSRFEPLRLRVMTPWDWRHRFRLVSFEIRAGRRAQPSVDWSAVVEERDDGQRRTVDGHVEVRWSHGRFGGRPEAKVYLDTPLSAVPGYVEL